MASSNIRPPLLGYVCCTYRHAPTLFSQMFHACLTGRTNPFLQVSDTQLATLRVQLPQSRSVSHYGGASQHAVVGQSAAMDPPAVVGHPTGVGQHAVVKQIAVKGRNAAWEITLNRQ